VRNCKPPRNTTTGIFSSSKAGSIVTVENSTELETPWIGPLNGFRAIDSAQSDRGSGNRQSGVLSFRTLAQDLFFNGFHPGMLVLAKKGNLRRGEWHHGNFVSDVDPTGYVVQIIQGLLAVQWIGHDFSDNTPKIRPDEDLGLHEITMGTEKYDRGKVPKNAPGNVQGSDLQFHNYVKFQDLTGASLKYQGQDEHGKLQVFPPAYSLGYDMNIYVITETKQQVKVQWQDLSETTEESTHLVPYINIDEHEVWPGEAIIRDMEDSGKRSIGIVQSVNAAERIAEVAWFLNPDGRFFERSKILIPDSTTRHLSTEKELVSFFEFKTCLEMSNRRGDMVLVAPSEEKDTSKGSGMNGWGEIVDLGLDGLVTVRLGALKEVQDIKVEPERVEVMFREGDPTGLDSYLAEDSPTYSPEWSSISDSAAEDLGVVQSHEEAPSIPLSGEKDWKEEAEDWLTDDDEAMQDSNESKFDMMDLDPPEGIVQRANSHRTDKQQTEKQFGAQPEALTSLDIASFSILDDEVPSDHEFRKGLENPTAKHLRRIQKEYKILSNALPDGIYVRTWEHRLDLMRVLFIGPRQTPYELAPFIVDFQFGCNFPMKPPEAHFHSWTEGIGRVNPNLYEDGKICLSLLGTWPGDEGNEKWSATQSSVLQILVSIMGLVLVKEPYYSKSRCLTPIPG
jgi:ubiquitin-conjugating enzyme E2 O